jgi:signal peptidase II
MLSKAAKSLALLLLVVMTIGCDRVTMLLAPETPAGAPARSYFADTFRLTYAENVGGFLSLGAGLPPALRNAVFTVVTGALLLVLALFAWRQRQSGSVWHAAALALFLAGGASNWFDRVSAGRVVDFMNVGIGWLRTGIFNVADVAIMLGAALFVLAELRFRRAQGNHE